MLLQKAEEKNATLLPLMERRIGYDRSNQPQKQVRLLLMQEESHPIFPNSSIPGQLQTVRKEGAGFPESAER